MSRILLSLAHMGGGEKKYVDHAFETNWIVPLGPNVNLFEDMLADFLGIERERTRVEWVSAAEGAKFAKTMNEFAETITKLGENRRLEDLRCKE